MAVKLRFRRMGRIHKPFYRLGAIDSRTPRDGRVIEELGYYDPMLEDKAKQFVVQLDRCRYWLDHGAIPSETVSSLLKRHGLDHKGLKIRKHVKPKPKTETPAPEAATA